MPPSQGNSDKGQILSFATAPIGETVNGDLVAGLDMLDETTLDQTPQAPTHLSV